MLALDVIRHVLTAAARLAAFSLAATLRIFTRAIKDVSRKRSSGVIDAEYTNWLFVGRHAARTPLLNLSINMDVL